MQKVYISGKITGLEEAVYMQRFKLAEQKLKKMCYIPINPAKKGKIPGYHWADYMRQDIQLLCDCDLIYLMPGWEESEGAKLEKELADRLSIPVLKIFSE